MLGSSRNPIYAILSGCPLSTGHISFIVTTGENLNWLGEKLESSISSKLFFQDFQ